MTRSTGCSIRLLKIHRSNSGNCYVYRWQGPCYVRPTRGTKKWSLISTPSTRTSANPTIIRTGYAARLSYKISPKWSSILGTGFTRETGSDEISTGVYFWTFGLLYALSPAINLGLDYQQTSQKEKESPRLNQKIALLHLNWKIL